jgi:hypothetical protein
VTKRRKMAKWGHVIKRDISPYLLQSLVNILGAEVAAVSSEFDIFVHKPIQTAVLGTVVTAYKPLAPLE